MWAQLRDGDYLILISDIIRGGSNIQATLERAKPHNLIALQHPPLSSVLTRAAQFLCFLNIGFGIRFLLKNRIP